MDLITQIQLILLLVLNVFFTFLGALLNAVVALSLWKSKQLRKKTCYFMIIVLSIFDSLAVITNHPIQAITSVAWLTKQDDALPTLTICEKVVNPFHAFSFLALMVMSFDRYLATSRPIFHRTSVTKRRLAIILGLSCFIDINLRVLSVTVLEVYFQAVSTIYFLLLVAIYLFINIKLLNLARRIRQNPISPQSTVKLKHISTCLLTMVCLVLFSFPVIFYTILILLGKLQSINVGLSVIWVNTTVTMNSTFNCMIYFWKNATLRKEGMKFLRSLKNK